MAARSSSAPTPSEAHKAIISQLIAEDAELREVARSFVLLGMKELVNQLARGDQTTRAMIARSLAGVMTKAITEGGEDEGAMGLRAEFHQMAAEIRGEWQDEQEPTPDTFQTPPLTPKSHSKSNSEA